MAEVVGLVLGVVGIAPVCAKCIKSIRRLRQIRSQLTEIPDEVKSLIDDLEALEPFIQQLEQTSTIDTSRCQAKLDDLNNGLIRLLDKIPPDFGGKRQKAKLVWEFRHWKDDVEALDKTVQKVKLDLILYGQMGQAAQMNCLSQMINAKLLDPIHVDDDAPQSAISPRSEISPTTQNMSLSSPARCRRPRMTLDCRQRCCPCSCHRIQKVSRRFWGFEYTPWQSWTQPCDRKSCSSSSYKLSLRVVLSQFGIPWSTTLELLVSTGMTLQIQPSLRIEQVVRYTSPGFAAIWRLSVGQITLEEAQTTLTNLSRTDNSFRMHVNPEGQSYLAYLVDEIRPPSRRYKETVALLDFLIREIQLDYGFDHKTFLINHARFPGVGADLLRLLQSHGFDLADVAALQVNEWRGPYHPDWIERRYFEDPFYLRYFTFFCRDDYEWAGMSLLHEAVLFHSAEKVRELCRCYDKDEGNFLGQTSLHLAVTRPELVQILIDAKLDVDAVDAYGVTPLMYAAACNELETIDLLIGAGADVLARDSLEYSTFLHYAAAHGHWDLLYHSLKSIQKLKDEFIIKGLLQETLFLYFIREPISAQRCNIPLHEILSIHPAVNFIVEDDYEEFTQNSLLHYVGKVEDVDTLLSYGLQLSNHTNERGEHALMGIMKRQGALDVLQYLLDLGLDVNLRDNSGLTTLHHAMEHFKAKMTCYSLLFDRLHVLVSRGANVFCGDNCRCSCSIQGCLPFAMLRSMPDTYKIRVKPAIHYLEWIILIFEYRGITAAKETVLALIRTFRHEALQMTHVCCSSSIYRRSPPLPDEDVDEILEEENEFIQILDEEMESNSRHDLDSLMKELFSPILQETQRSMQQCCKIIDQVRIESHQAKFIIDFENDRYSHRLHFWPTSWADITRPLEEDVGNYVKWLEDNCRTSKSTDGFLTEERYYRRLSWLYLYSKSLKLSAPILQKSPYHDPYREWTPEQLEQSSRHFRDSWTKWEQGQMDHLTASGCFADRQWNLADWVDDSTPSTLIVDVPI